MSPKIPGHKVKTPAEGTSNLATKVPEDATAMNAGGPEGAVPDSQDAILSLESADAPVSRRKECEALVSEMAESFSSLLKKEAMRLYDSGGVDPDQYGNTYRLPNILMSAALENLKSSYLSRDPKDRKTVANLRFF